LINDFVLNNINENGTPNKENVDKLKLEEFLLILKNPK